jgi:exodeoxyribonuclease III
MRLATWNVNSIRQREQHVLRRLERAEPDILLLQEIKCETTAFPALTYHGLGYQAEAVGQKAYNGVAVLSRRRFVCRSRSLPGLPDSDTQARFIEIETEGLTLIDIYLPNGNSGGTEGYAYKLAWMDALAAHAEALMDEDRPFAIMGDFNVCPTGEDFAPGTLPRTDALVRPETRARFRRLLWAGLVDAIRAIHPHGPVWTFWDYQAGCWQRDLGLRIDHALLSPELAERLVGADPDRDVRGEPQPSDHVPVVVELA